MHHPSLLAAALSAITLLAACGSEVIDNPTGGTGGSATTSGTGGTSTTSGTGGSTTTATTGTGGAPAVCGGKIGAPCGPDEWCQFDPSAQCGGFDETGICQPKPPGCTADCPGVCGCDGKFYCNACSAHEAGVDVNPNLTCDVEEMDSYRAVNVFTNVPRFVILKSSPSRNLCFRLMVEPNPNGWHVTVAQATNDLNDCAIGPGSPPSPMGDQALGSPSSGMVTVMGYEVGCIASIHQKMTFPNNPDWAPPAEAFDADALGIEGGCP
ncbi:MAG: hypothetical protein QM820_50180 [Minicystis sp.]